MLNLPVRADLAIITRAAHGKMRTCLLTDRMTGEFLKEVQQTFPSPILMIFFVLYGSKHTFGYVWDSWSNTISNIINALQAVENYYRNFLFIYLSFNIR